MPAVLARFPPRRKGLCQSVRPQDSPTNQGPAAVSFVVTKNRTNSNTRVTESSSSKQGDGEGGKNVMETQLDDSFRLVNKQISPIEMLVQVPLAELFHPRPNGIIVK